MNSKLQQEREVNGGTPFAEARGYAAPVVMEETWCDPQCPHFQPPTDCVKLDGRCKLLNVSLDYYDWFLAACKYEAQHNNTICNTGDKENRS